VPTLTAADFVVATVIQELGTATTFTRDSAAVLAALKAAKAAGAMVGHAMVVADAANSELDSFMASILELAPQGVVAKLPSLSLPGSLDGPSYLGELALKLTLNAITVGAHIRKGTIYRNRMINVMMTNAKLFFRAIGIVADVTSAGSEIAARSILRSIYHRDDVFADDGVKLLVPDFSRTSGDLYVDKWPEANKLSFAQILCLLVSTHVHVASSQLDLVPVAILLAVNEIVRARNGDKEPLLKVSEAEALLAAEPVIRKALISVLQK
jgi:hypothetical protein